LHPNQFDILIHSFSIVKYHKYRGDLAMTGERRVQFPNLPIEELRSIFPLRVITPNDDAYDEARSTFYGGIDRRPAVIIRVKNSDEVARVIALARDTGMELAVRSGGHSAAGHCVSDGGIVLDLSLMRDLLINRDALTAWAEPGLTAAAYTSAAAEYGLATGFGDTGSVGIGGITLGGGVGYLVRKYGLTIDDLLGAQIVTADGQHLEIDSESHPDLFWAIRGGGGNFGVVTRFKFRLHPVDSVVGGMLFLPATADTIASFIELAEAAPDELSAIANVATAPPMPFLAAEHHGKPVIMAMIVYIGDAAEGESAIAPFRALATPLADILRPMQYPEIYPPEQEGYHPVAASRTMFMDYIDREIAALILDRIQASNASMAVAQLRVLGGAMARVPVEATAFAHRNSKIMVNIAALYDKGEDKEIHEAWVRDLAAALQQSDNGAYVNFLGDDGTERIRAAYPDATWERLTAIKAKYDPTNLFHLNQNITPVLD
jgi:FAD/FMN-containing dehydrogenase